MSDVVNVEDFQTDSQHSGVLRKPVHHLSPISPTALLRESSSGSTQNEVLNIEDFNENNDTTDHDLELQNHVNERELTMFSDTSCQQSVPETVSPPVATCQNRETETKSSMRDAIPLDIEFIIGANKYLPSEDCQLEDKLLDVNLCEDIEFDGNSSPQFSGLEQEVELVNHTKKEIICNDFEFNALPNNFKLVEEVQFDQGKINFALHKDFNYDKGVTSFSLHDTLNCKIASDIRIIGENDCSVSKKEPLFFLTETKNVVLKDRSNYFIPKYHNANKPITSNCKFAIPDCSSYGVDESNRFFIFKDLKTFKNRDKFTVPVDWSDGQGTSHCHIPVCPSGIRKTHAHSSIPSEVALNDKNTMLSKPAEYKYASPRSNCKLISPQEVEITNITKGITIHENPEGEIISKGVVYNQKDSTLLNKDRVFSFWDDALLYNIHSYKLNQLEICWHGQQIDAG